MGRWAVRSLTQGRLSCNSDRARPTCQAELGPGVKGDRDAARGPHGPPQPHPAWSARRTNMTNTGPGLRPAGRLPTF